MTYTYSVLAPAGSADLNTFHPAACCLRSGFSLFDSASFSLPMIISKSAVLSGLMKLSTMPASLGKMRAFDTACACAAGAPVVVAGGGVAGGVAGGCCARTTFDDSTPTRTTRAIQPGRPPGTSATAIRRITASLTKRVVTVTYSGLHEHCHYLMGQQHAATRQPHPGAITL